MVCGAKERTDVGAELGTVEHVGAELGVVRNSEFRTYIALPRGSAIQVRFGIFEPVETLDSEVSPPHSVMNVAVATPFAPHAARQAK